jgi:hypothetical protein
MDLPHNRCIDKIDFAEIDDGIGQEVPCRLGIRP